jgi:ABC-type multidrug transport system ATPase subunit
MDEAQLCDRVALIQNGHILSINTPQGIVDDFAHPLWAVKSNRMLFLLNEIKATDFVKDVYPFGEFHHVVLKAASGEAQLKTLIQNHQNDGAVIQPAEADIEDCFIALMKN